MAATRTSDHLVRGMKPEESQFVRGLIVAAN